MKILLILAVLLGVIAPNTATVPVDMPIVEIEQVEYEETLVPVYVGEYDPEFELGVNPDKLFRKGQPVKLMTAPEGVGYEAIASRFWNDKDNPFKEDWVPVETKTYPVKVKFNVIEEVVTPASSEEIELLSLKLKRETELKTEIKALEDKEEATEDDKKELARKRELLHEVQKEIEELRPIVEKGHVEKQAVEKEAKGVLILVEPNKYELTVHHHILIRGEEVRLLTECHLIPIDYDGEIDPEIFAQSLEFDGISVGLDKKMTKYKDDVIDLYYTDEVRPNPTQTEAKVDAAVSQPTTPVGNSLPATGDNGLMGGVVIFCCGVILLGLAYFVYKKH